MRTVFQIVHTIRYCEGLTLALGSVRYPLPDESASIIDNHGLIKLVWWGDQS